MLETIRLTAQEALSGISGSISLASWVFLLIPQLVQNYQLQNADAISLNFLFIWLVGDLSNLFGAVWAGLVPTVVVVAVYFCFADVILITQCMYYNIKSARKARELEPRIDGHMIEEENEQEPLLRRTNSDNLGLPGSRRRHSSASNKRRASSVLSNLPTISEAETPAREWLKNAGSILLVSLAGTLGWVVAWKSGVWQPTPIESVGDSLEEPIGAEILGYLSAVCYLGARIPQIVKNHREQSCEGLALLFFMLSLLGNATFGAQIIFHSREKQYLLINTPWLVGSFGTMVEDIIIFIQFHSYSAKNRETSSTAIE